MHADGSRGRRGRTVVLTLAMLVATLPPIVADVASPAPAAASPTTAPLTAEQALAQARSTRKPVAVAGSTTATDTLVANPSGTFTLTRSVAPERKRVDGQWKPLDSTLRRNADGSITPAVTTSGLRLSGGGSGPAVTLTDAGRSLSLSVPFALPAPVLSGASATYTGVLPGVDLRLTADVQGGVRQVLVVHDAAAAANPALAALRLGARTAGLTVAADQAGNLAASDPRGRPVFSANAPIMWDSGTAAAAGYARSVAPEIVPQPSTADGPGTHARTAPIHTAASMTSPTSGEISLVPDHDVLSGPGTTFPVFIDPGWVPVGMDKNGWATVTHNFPGSNYWNNTPDPQGRMQVGNSGEIWSRTLVNFPVPLTTLAGATILEAKLFVHNAYSYSCTARQMNVTAPSATLTSGNATWNAWNSAMGSVVATGTFAHGYNSSCLPGGESFVVTGTIAADVAAWRGTRTFGLIAADESTYSYYKEFNPGQTTMSVTYNHAPNQPSELTTSPATACGANPPSTVGDGNVNLYAKVVDAEGGSLGVAYQLWKTADSGQTLLASSDPALLTYPSGSFATLIVPVATFRTASAGTPTQFSWRVKVTDSVFESPWSPTCTFLYDPTRTGAPTVTKPASTTIGQPATFTIAGPATGTVPSGYLYQLNAGPPTQVTATSGNASITVTPGRSTNVLTVTSLSAGSNIGDNATVVFNSNAAATAADQDITGDGKADLHAVGAVNGLPAGLWQGRGTGGGVDVAGINIGANGNGVAGDNLPSNFTGAQAVTGRFTGTGLQDFLVYYPGGANPGSGMIINGIGDGSVLQAQRSGNEHTISAGLLSDINGLNPLQVVNAYDSAGQGLAYPDLLTVNGDGTNGYYLTYVASQNGINNYQFPVQLTTAPPVGGTTWNAWTITTARTASGTSMFLWHKASGALYLWKNVTADLNAGTLGYTQSQLSSSWNANAAISLQAADINADGSTDLWTVGAAQAVQAWIVGSTGTITGKGNQTLVTSEHYWPLTAVAGTATGDTTGGSTLTASGTAGNVVVHTGDTFDPSIKLNTAANGTVVASPNGTLVGATPIINTNQSFTVSVWVKPTATGGVIVSEDGAHTARFYLSDNAADNTWRFGLATSDTAGAAYDVVTVPAGNQLGVWTHLLAAYDAQSSAMTLYVNKVHKGTATHSTTVAWPSTGGFALGSAVFNNARGSYFAGQLSGAQAWNSRLTSAMVGSPGGGVSWNTKHLVDGGSSFTDIAVGDMNNDGKNDLVGLTSNGNVYLVANNALNGISWSATTLIDGLSGFVKIGVGDMNNDGKNDLVGLASNGNVYLVPNNATNGVSWGATTLIYGLSPYVDIAVGDLDTNGKTDLLGIRANSDVYYTQNNGTNTVSWGPNILIDSGSGFATIAVGDMNNDGKGDLVGLASNSNVYDLPHTGTNWGTQVLIVNVSGFVQVAAADLNNDGKCDLIGLDAGTNVYDLANNA